MMTRRFGLVARQGCFGLLLVLALLAAGLVLAPPPASAATADAYMPMTPVRAADTRNGTGVDEGPVAAGQLSRSRSPGSCRCPPMRRPCH